jgi:Na+/H+ antiporter NhaD/arsenite permease-like protein
MPARAIGEMGNKRERMLDGISWGALPLVAGLFVLVEALGKTGLIRALGDVLRSAAEQSEPRRPGEPGSSTPLPAT